jgi:hypothetical protein
MTMLLAAALQYFFRRCGSSVLIRLKISASFLAIALSRQRFLNALLLARLQIKRVPLDLFNDVFLEDLALETLECALQALAFVNLNFSQRNSPRFPIRFESSA